MSETVNGEIQPLVTDGPVEFEGKPHTFENASFEMDFAKVKEFRP